VANDVTSTNYIDTGLSNGSTWYYVVAACNSAGISADSNEANATPQPPSIAASLIAPEAEITLSWPSWAVGFDLYVATNLNSPSAWSPATSSPQSSNGTLYLNLATTNAGQMFFRLGSP